MSDLTPIFAGIPIRVDPTLEPGMIELHHPDGRVDRLDVDPERRRRAFQAAVVMVASWWGMGWWTVGDVVYLFTPPPVLEWDFTVELFHEQYTYTPKPARAILRNLTS